MLLDRREREAQNSLLFAFDARLTSSAHSDRVKRSSITIAYAFAY